MNTILLNNVVRATILNAADVVKEHKYTRERGAAWKDDPVAGWDLERWDFAGSTGHREEAAAAGVPSDAAYHVGYLDRDGVQCWVYVRRAPNTYGALGALL